MIISYLKSHSGLKIAYMLKFLASITRTFKKKFRRPRNIDDNQFRRMLKNEIRRNLLVQIWHFRRKSYEKVRTNKLFLRVKFHKYKKNTKCQYLSEQLVSMNIKCQIRILQESSELYKLCMIDLENF